MNSWFGETNTKWDVVPLREFAVIGTGHTPSRDNESYWENCNIPWVTVEDLRKNGINSLKPITDTSQKISELGLKNSAAVLHPKGTVMLSRTASIGFSCVIDSEMATTQAFVTWTPKKNKLNSDYLNATLMVMRDHYFALAYGATHLTIYFPDIKTLKIPLPPLLDQVKIANFLGHETANIDALIEKQQQLIKLLKEKRQAVIGHAVTKGLNPNAPMRDSGVEWLGEVPEHWDVAKVSHRYEIRLGKMLDVKKVTGNHLGSYLRNTDVQWDRINTDDLPQMDFRPEEYQRYSVKKGDLIVCEGGDIGRSAIWNLDETCFYQKALHRLRPHYHSKDHTRFMFYLMFDAVHQERLSGGIEKATIAHLPAETFRQYRFAYPPHVEQVTISNFLDKINTKFELVEATARKQIELFQERRTALISAAVTGKIDVRNWQAPEPSHTNNKEVAP